MPNCRAICDGLTPGCSTWPGRWRSFAALDYAANVSPHYQFGSIFGRNVPVVSAADASGFNRVVGTKGHNAMLVIVESLGYMNDAKLRDRIADPLSGPRITSKYR